MIALCRNLALLTSTTTEELRTTTLRITTIFNLLFFAAGTGTAAFTASGVITPSEQEEKFFAMLVIACIMVFAGLISPRLPFTRHTGLRFPWTIRDRDTWNLAHKILGIISLPLALLYVACALPIDDLKLVSLLAMLLWIGIPGGISGVFWIKKTHGR